MEPVRTEASITYNSEFDCSGATVTNLTCSGETIPATTNGLLVVCILQDDSSPTTITAVEWDNGVTDQVLSEVTSGEARQNNSRAEMWYVVNPVATTGDLFINWSGTMDNIVAIATIYEGVKQTSTEEDSTATAVDENNSVFGNATSSTNGAWGIDCITDHLSTDTATVNGGQTLRKHMNNASDGIGHAVATSTEPVPTAGVFSMGYTTAPDATPDLAHVMAAFAPSAAGGGSTGIGVHNNVTYNNVTLK